MAKKKKRPTTTNEVDETQDASFQDDPINRTTYGGTFYNARASAIEDRLPGELMAGVWGANEEEEMRRRVLLPETLLSTVKVMQICAMANVIYITMMCGYRPRATNHTIVADLTDEERFRFLLYWSTSALHTLSLMFMFARLSFAKVLLALVCGALDFVWHCLNIVFYFTLPIDDKSDEDKELWRAVIYWLQMGICFILIDCTVILLLRVNFVIMDPEEQALYEQELEDEEFEAPAKDTALTKAADDEEELEDLDKPKEDTKKTKKSAGTASGRRNSVEKKMGRKKKKSEFSDDEDDYDDYEYDDRRPRRHRRHDDGSDDDRMSVMSRRSGYGRMGGRRREDDEFGETGYSEFSRAESRERRRSRGGTRRRRDYHDEESDGYEDTFYNTMRNTRTNAGRRRSNEGHRRRQSE